MSSRGICGALDAGGGVVVVLGVAVDLLAGFLTFVSRAAVVFAVSCLAGFAIFLAGALTAFDEVASTLVAVDWLVFFAGIGAYL
jgi:hypothetical protein